MVYDSDSLLWFATDKGLFSYHNKQWEEYGTGTALQGKNLTWMAIDNRNNKWLGTSNDGIIYIQTADNSSPVLPASNVKKTEQVIAITTQSQSCIISFALKAKPTSIKILDIRGRVIQDVSPLNRISGSVICDTKGFAYGYYIVRITDAMGRVFSQKFIKM